MQIIELLQKIPASDKQIFYHYQNRPGIFEIIQIGSKKKRP